MIRYGRSSILVIGVGLFTCVMLGSSTNLPRRNQAPQVKKGKTTTVASTHGESRPSTAVHVVRSGDTLYEIARANRMSVRELKAINHLQSNRLKIGQKLLLGAGTMISARSRRRNAGSGVNEAQTDNSVTPSMESSPSAAQESPVITLRSATSPLGDGNSLLGGDSKPSMRSQLVQAGMDFLGVPYHWTGVSESRGVDCSGLVMALFDRFNIELPHSARMQFRVGEKVAKTELAIGDLVFFSTRGKIPTHVGIYIGNGQFIHAARRAGQVVISSLSESWYQKRFIGARRIEELWKDEQKPQEAKGN